MDKNDKFGCLTIIEKFESLNKVARSLAISLNEVIRSAPMAVKSSVSCLNANTKAIETDVWIKLLVGDVKEIMGKNE